MSACSDFSGTLDDPCGKSVLRRGPCKFVFACGSRLAKAFWLGAVLTIIVTPGNSLYSCTNGSSDP